MDTRRTGILKHRILFVIIGMSILLNKTMSGASWMRTYGGPGHDRGFYVLQTQDGGYLAIGMTSPSDASYSALWIIRADSLGDTLWTQEYGGSDGDCGGYYITNTSDGYYIIAGVSNASHGTGNAWLLKIDSSGDTLWTRTYGEDGGFLCGVETPDNGYLLVGGIQSGEYTNDLWLVKTDSLGDTICTRTYRPEGDSYCAGYYVIPTQDGNYIVLGERTPLAMQSIWLLKANSLGDTLWTRTYGEETCQDIGYCLVETEDGGYLIIGMTNLYEIERSALWLIRTDSLGDTLWTRVYGNEMFYTGGRFIAPTEGCYVIIGYIEPLFGPEDIWLLKVNASGDTLWTRTYGGKDEDWGGCIRETFDHGYIIVGDTRSYGEGNADVWLIKTDSLGYVGVEEGKPNLNILWESYPNPFTRWINVRYHSPVEGTVSIEIYDIAGRFIKTLEKGQKAPGYYTLRWNGKDSKGDTVASGIYFIKLEIGELTLSRKVLCLH